ncbi:MAG TPA: DUF4388 domain-containing protein [Candidatus Polarisedimenticolia bacterium]|jgi:tetratricopeptide (TPR) repeat protein
MSEHFTSHYLAEILRDLYFEESTGTIEVRNPSGRFVTLHFDRGMLYFAEGNDPLEAFEAHLSSSGALPAGTLSKLKGSASEPLEMAANLVSRKILSREQVAPAIRSLVEGGVRRAFSWPSGTYEFKARQPVSGFFEPDVLFTFECILKGIGGMAYFEPLKQVLLSLPGRLALSKNVFLPVERLALKPQHGYILSRIDGSMRIEELALVLPPGEEAESLLFVYGLAVLGIVVFVPPINKGLFSLREVMLGHYESTAREEREASLIRDTSARMMGQSPADLLGVEPDAALPELQHAYEHLKGTFRRSRFCDRTRERFKRELALIDNKIAEAFLKLQVERLEKAGRAASGDAPLSEIDPESILVRREMVKTEAQAAQEENVKLAEKYYQKAREYFSDKDYHNCIQFCRLAIRFSTDSAPVYALMAEALLKNPNTKWQKMAEEALQKACEIDPWNAEYEVTLGNFYRGQGLEIRARKHFEKALEILPSHIEAKAALKVRGRRG